MVGTAWPKKQVKSAPRGIFWGQTWPVMGRVFRSNITPEKQVLVWERSLGIKPYFFAKLSPAACIWQFFFQTTYSVQIGLGNLGTLGWLSWHPELLPDKVKKFKYWTWAVQILTCFVKREAFKLLTVFQDSLKRGMARTTLIKNREFEATHLVNRGYWWLPHHVKVED